MHLGSEKKSKPFCPVCGLHYLWEYLGNTMNKPQITIKDIARALNVSPSTVSRALKDNPDISQETRDLIHQMQPFKMMVGDMVNEKQKGLAYSIQSFLCNAGSLVGFLFPFIFTSIGISNTASQGVIPDSVVYSFYIGAAILILCVIYTSVKVKEMPPAEYAEYHGITAEDEKRRPTC